MMEILRLNRTVLHNKRLLWNIFLYDNSFKTDCQFPKIPCNESSGTQEALRFLPGFVTNRLRRLAANKKRC